MSPSYAVPRLTLRQDKETLRVVATPVLAAGKMLGRYQVLKPLAKGGMAEVLLARSIGLKGFERHVVIKRIRVEQEGDQAVNMFLDEARLVASLHHRNIVQVHDVGEADGKYFFAMEYVHGEDARTLLRQVKDRKEKVPLEHIVTIVAAAAAGLHYAHEQRGPDRKPLGIVHRDISPGNILIGFDGGVKVVDFGIAKTDRRESDTQAGEMKGKLGYMSPEQCRAQPIDRRTDVFLLGIVLYELVTVRRLFKGESRYETMAAIVEGNIPPPSKYRPDLPAALEAIIMMALSVEADERYQTADELRLALEAFATTAGLQASASRLSDYVKQLFGERPEPWLVDAPPPPITDFDVSVVTPMPGVVKTIQPDPVPAPEPEEPQAVFPIDVSAERRRVWILGSIGAAGIVLVLVISVVLSRSARSSETTAAPVTTPAAATPDARVDEAVVAPPIDAGVVEPITIDAAVETAEVDAGVTEPVATKPTKPGKPGRPRPTRPGKPKPDKPDKPDPVDPPPPVEEDLDSPFPK